MMTIPAPPVGADQRLITSYTNAVDLTARAEALVAERDTVQRQIADLRDRIDATRDGADLVQLEADQRILQRRAADLAPQIAEAEAAADQARYQYTHLSSQYYRRASDARSHAKHAEWRQRWIQRHSKPTI